MRYPFVSLLLIACLPVCGQITIGTPEIVSYSKQQYAAGTQNWNIRQDSRGLMYFANNEGLLSFDGTYWKLYPLPNKTIVRSIDVAPGGEIYAGAQDEIGCFRPDTAGRLRYESLKPLIPERNRSFADVWETHIYGDGVFFRTRGEIFQLSGSGIRVHHAPTEWLFMGKTDKLLIAQDAREGLMFYKNGSWLPMNTRIPVGVTLSAIISYAGDTSLVTTIRDGAWLVTPHSAQRLNLGGANISPTERFSSVANINNELFALGSTSGGCFIMNRDGKIIRRFSKGTGLSNSSVISVYRDKSRNLWLGHDNGIDFIAFDNAVRHINPPGLNNGTGYGSAVFNNRLYLAMSNGVFTTEMPKGKDISESSSSFEPVRNTWGQAWGLSVANGHLLLGSHEGPFKIEGTQATRLPGQYGFWTYAPYRTASGAEQIVAGNYNGINIIGDDGGILGDPFPVRGYNESSRFLVIGKNGSIWTSHPYRGVYRIDPAADGRFDVKLFASGEGLPSNMSNHVYKIKNRIVVGTEAGVYEHDARKDSFVRSEYFQSIFGTTSVRYLKEDPGGNIWFIHEKDLGVVDFSTITPRIIYLPELKGRMVSGFEHINPINDNNILIGAQEGFYHIDYEKYRKNDIAVDVEIRTVQALGSPDSVLYAGYPLPQKAPPQIRHHSNSLHIEYSAPLYGQQASIEYSFFLDGFDKSWSEWSKKTEKDYTNLPPGRYRFLVKARNNLGNESEAANYTFTILPPWYRSPLAYFIYVILAAFACWYLYRRLQKKFHNQRQKYLEKQRQLEYLHQLELEKSEKEIVKLRNERLQSQIEHKNSELASTAMHLVQKGEILTRIKDELVRLNKQPANPEVSANIRKIVKVLNQDEKVNEDWEHFATHFNNVHSDFLISLKESYPNLNAHDLKLCAYLRMNLTSKEIAQLMNISIRGVEIGRYRLRKKLAIPTEVNLFNFMLNFHSQIGVKAE